VEKNRTFNLRLLNSATTFSSLDVMASDGDDHFKFYVLWLFFSSSNGNRSFRDDET
jgi:hypothetical protein